MEEQFFKELIELCKKHNVLIYPGDEDMIYPSIVFDFHYENRYVYSGDEIDFNKKNLFESLKDINPDIII